jgi:hypothetical protein
MRRGFTWTPVTPVEWTLLACVAGLLGLRLASSQKKAGERAVELSVALGEPEQRSRLLPKLRGYVEQEGWPGTSPRPTLALDMAALELTMRRPVRALQVLDQLQPRSLDRADRAAWLLQRARAHHQLADFRRSEALASDVQSELHYGSDTALGSRALALRADALLSLGRDAEVCRLVSEQLPGLHPDGRTPAQLALARALGRLGQMGQWVEELLLEVAQHAPLRLRRFVREWPFEPAARVANRLLAGQGPYR